MRAIINGQGLSYAQLRKNWGYCNDGDTNTVGFLLRLLREQFGYSRVFQRCGFGINEADFLRLQRMACPEADRFGANVRQIALACNIPNIRSFLLAIEQANELAEA